jgi:hypothetical protein
MSVVDVAPSCLRRFLRKVAPRRHSSVWDVNPDIVFSETNFDSARKKISSSQYSMEGIVNRSLLLVLGGHRN